MTQFRFFRKDHDNCRTYYRDEAKRLFCIQDEGYPHKATLVFYRCSQDGEPSYPVPMPPMHDFNRFVTPE